MSEKKKDKKPREDAPVETVEKTETVETETSAADEAKNELAALKTEVERLAKEKDAEHDRLLRTAAEYDNYRRRTAEEMTRKFGDGKAEALEKLLPVADSVKLALSGEHDEDDPVYKGLCLIAKQLSDSLVSLGVTEIPTDVPFDPNLHNAVMHIDDEARGEGEIVDVFQTGYKLGDRVLRHSMVRVAN